MVIGCARDLNWLHTVGTSNLMYHAVDRQRGRDACARIGILPGGAQKSVLW